jgi:hypothetical protein
MISTPECFVDLQAKGLCDGFLWPYESPRLPNFAWRDGSTAARFETRRGTLFMHPDAIVSYGYREVPDFARAAMRGQLSVKTPRGILTVGALRNNPNCSRAVYLGRDDCFVKLEFPVSTPMEESEVLAILRSNIPDSTVVSGPRWLSGATPPTPSFGKSLKLAWESPHRDTLIVMGILVLVVPGLCLAGFFNRQWYLAAGLLSAIFLALFVILARRSKEIPPSSEKSTLSTTLPDR